MLRLPEATSSTVQRFLQLVSLHLLWRQEDALSRVVETKKTMMKRRKGYRDYAATALIDSRRDLYRNRAISQGPEAEEQRWVIRFADTISDREVSSSKTAACQEDSLFSQSSLSPLLSQSVYVRESPTT